jgi:hypothetical protein
MINKVLKNLEHGNLLRPILYRFGNLVLLKIFRKFHTYNAFIYKVRFGFKKSINNPETFSEKISYLRNYYMNIKVATIISDKIAVREYVANRIGGEVLNKLLFTTDNPDNIDYESLPDQFVIKTNHAVGTNIFVKDKSLIDKREIYVKLTKWMNMNYGAKTAGMQYFNIKPQIIIEKYLEDDGGEYLITNFGALVVMLVTYKLLIEIQKDLQDIVSTKILPSVIGIQKKVMIMRILANPNH